MSDAQALKTKLVEWKRRLSDRDVHSIAQQLGRMLWRSAFYRSINESRRYLLDDAEASKFANGALHELIDDGFFNLNAMAIRRLLDKGPSSGPKGVNSLYGLIKDVAAHAHLITRANVLEARGLEYDFQPIRQKALDDAWAERKARNTNASFISGEGWAEAESWHRFMDKLCGVTSDNRSPSDVPGRGKFQSLLDELERRGRTVRGWVDKFAAHAASPESIQTLDADHQALSLAKLWLAERVVVRVANFVALYVVDGVNLGGVAIPQFDQFAHLDRPFIEPAALEPMEKAWAAHAKDIRSCERWFWDRPLADESDVWDDME
jgi:hypothetical protein